MALGKVQQQIVAQLEDMERLSPEQQDVILATPGDLTGDALDRLLQDEYKITDFQLLVAKARAHGLAPFNVGRYQISSATFERVPQEFCQQNLVLPVGEVGNYLLVALANPFEVTISTKIQEMTGKKVVRLLGRERDIRDKFNKNQQVEVQFTDVVEKIGIEFG
ncbi:MAG TPA: type II/IV secretion system protein, partial [Opitutaceae bacterium]|nr:type II/IV secretion system protein [Opitutaceae bacterium]